LNLLRQLSVVVPILNEEDCIDAFFSETYKSLKHFDSWEVIFVDDGSSDASWIKIEKLAMQNQNVRGVRLTRNFGHQIAVSAGLELARCDAIAIIDADLQDPPSLLPKMYELVSTDVDIIYGKRLSRKGESVFKKTTAKIFYRVFRLLVPFDIPLDTGDFRIISKKVKDQVVSMNEQDPFLRGLFALTGYSSIPFEYERQPRKAGESKYNLRKMLNLAVNAILTFSDFPLRLFTKISLFLLSLAVLGGVWAITLSVIGGAISGWLSIFSLVLFLGSLNIILSSIVGAYVLQAVKASRQRPRFFVSQTIN
jgi:glycosyltransferase involved in cell wall biosynthesis